MTEAEKKEFIKVFLSVSNLCQRPKPESCKKCKFLSLDKCREYNLRLSWEIIELRHRYDDKGGNQ
jgi:hypothetical protein